MISPPTKGQFQRLKHLLENFLYGTDASTVIEYINAKIDNEIASIPSALDLYKVSNNAAVSENASAISALQEKVEALESVEFIPITEEQIDILFESLNTSSD